MNIAITGYGIVSALGVGREATLDALSHGRGGVGRMRILKSAHCDLPVGEVPLTDAELADIAGVPCIDVPRSTLLGIVAAKEALQNARVSDVCEMAFISGTTVGGMDVTERLWNKCDDAAVCKTIAQKHSADSCTRDISDALGKFGFMTTISTACSSALNAIIYGADLIRTRRFRRVLVGGTEALTLFHLNGFNSLRILDSALCRPFDESRNGLNLGEGAAYLVIEDEDSALDRNVPVLAYIGGYANCCDAFHQTATSDDAVGPSMAMSKALQCAGIAPCDVDYINTHGTGTPNNDQTELTAVHNVFGNAVPPFSSTKCFTGHTTSASGSIETVICLLTMESQTAFANFSAKQPIEGSNSLVLAKAYNRADVVMCNSFGFGGNDSSLILSRYALAHNDEPCLELALQTFAESCENPDECKQFLGPMQVRRMTPQMRCVVAAVHKSLRKAGIDKPDAIIAQTKWGCKHNSLIFLNDMLNNAEQELSPTPFMQSTHNTVASQIAIMLGCHGYNSTIVPDMAYPHAADTDAVMLLQTGVARSVLLIDFEEPDIEWDAMLEKAGAEIKHMANATIIMIE
ncbi:MAG: beta-ketoacyl synthase chain length factor [Paludibacteraceae bacterium]|nr:beta-ketoacyl synthase chain length factor [Paludibacteraceae bacterium]